MDDFDRRLEIDLKLLLDPVVCVPVPRRPRLVTFQALPGGLIAEAKAQVEVMVVPEPVPVVASTPIGTPL